MNLDDLEIKCDCCEDGRLPPYSQYNDQHYSFKCNQCDGRGKVLSEQGELLIDFLDRHFMPKIKDRIAKALD